MWKMVHGECLVYNKAFAKVAIFYKNVPIENIILVDPSPKYFQAYKGGTMKASRKTFYDKVGFFWQKGHF